MTNGMRLRKLMRARGRRYASRTRAARSAEPMTKGQRIRLMRMSVCGVLFVTLIALKLLLPGNLAAFRATLGHALVRDADFAAAFAAIGHAAAAPREMADSLGEAYVAVFGVSQEATEVSAPITQEVEILSLERELPTFAVAEQRILGFRYASPLAGEVTSAFGWRDDPNGGSVEFHCGLDIAAPEGTEIACFADGTVGIVGDSTELGKYVTVEHENGIETLYAHCSKISVSSGQSVALGDKLGEVGATGNATGEHLHFEVHDGAQYLNPVYYVAQ